MGAQGLSWTAYGSLLLIMLVVALPVVVGLSMITMTLANRLAVIRAGVAGRRQGLLLRRGKVLLGSGSRASSDLLH